MSVVKLYASQAASVALVSVSADVPLDGHITSVALGVAINNEAAPTNGQVATAEISFSSTPQFTSNDVRNSLCQAAAVLIAGTTVSPGIGIPGIPFCVLTGLKVRIYAGEKVWLHLQGNTALIDQFNAVGYIYIEDNEDRGRVRARSRRG